MFPMLWAWSYSFLLRNTHHSSMCNRPGMSNRAGQLNNNIHTVFTHLGLHFLTGGIETLKTIQIWAGNHTKCHLQLMQRPWCLRSAIVVERFISVLTKRREEEISLELWIESIMQKLHTGLTVQNIQLCWRNQKLPSHRSCLFSHTFSFFPV